jgi:HEAT repeat protein
MGEYINSADTILIGETFEIDDQLYIKVKKVLKGDDNYKNSDVALFNDLDKKTIISSGSGVYVPSQAKDVAVLLTKNWHKLPTTMMIQKTYTSRKSIKSLMKLSKIMVIENEAKRLKAIKKEMLKGDIAFQEQFYIEMNKMYNPENFSILIDYFNKTDSKNKIKLIEKFSDINDIRAVPVLIKSLSSDSEEIREEAAHTLYYHFSGAEGVTNAFIKNSKIKGVNYYAVKYLEKYFIDINKDDLQNQKEHPWYIAKQLIAQGKNQQAKAIYYELIADTNQKISDRIYLSNLLLEIAEQQDKEYLLNQMLPLLTIQIQDGVFTKVEQAVSLLRKLKDKKCLPALLETLNFNEFIYETALFIAVLAIEDLGIEAREKAVEIILQKFKGRQPNELYKRQYEVYAVALAWLNTNPNFHEYQPLFTKHFIEKLSLITTKNQALDQAVFFNNLLKKIPTERTRVEMLLEKLAIIRLSEMKNQKEITVLIKRIENSNKYDYDYATEKALVSIGGENIETEMIRLLKNSKKHIRVKATRILSELIKERSLPYLKKMLIDDNFGDKNTAYTFLSLYGTPKEITQLKPYCNYWQKDKMYVYGSCQAIVGIWDRHNYDLNGLIIKRELPQ